MMALFYVLFDLPFRMTGFLSLDGWAGPKNVLPLVAGLILGPAGAVGVTGSALILPLLIGAGIRASVLESLAAAAISFGFPFFWYALKGAREFRLKTPAEYLKYFLLLCIFSALGGGLAFLLTGYGFWETSLSFSAWGLLLGIPIIVLMMSMFGFRAECKEKFRILPDIHAVIENTPAGTGSINDLIYELICQKQINRKHYFNIMTCVEELLIRINANVDKVTAITVILYDGDAISVSISYGGNVKYNPLVIGKTENREDILGLMLLKQKALRASYSFRNKVNRVDIVV